MEGSEVRGPELWSSAASVRPHEWRGPPVAKRTLVGVTSHDRIWELWLHVTTIPPELRKGEKPVG